MASSASSSNVAKQFKAAGEDNWKNKTDKINSELFTLTYGALVVQLVNDYEDYEQVNIQLDKMGYNIGTRLIEDLLARTNLNLGSCNDFKQVAEAVSKIGFKTFLNITPTIIHPDPSSTSASHPQDPTSSSTSPFPSNITTTNNNPANSQEFHLQLDENPLAEFVELPKEALNSAANDTKRKDGKYQGLWYSNVLAGVIRGALEMVQLQTEVCFLSDTLRGDETTLIRVKLIKRLDEQVPVGDE